MAAPKESAPSHAPTPRAGKQRSKGRVSTVPTTYGQVAQGGYDEAKRDLSPWIETMASSRVSRHRYDHINNAVQVLWSGRNAANPGYIYLDVPYDAYRNFARSASTGKAVNRILNGFDYRPMTPDEYSAGSNTTRRGLTSRLGGQ
jgi:hypothetical protein